MDLLSQPAETGAVVVIVMAFVGLLKTIVAKVPINGKKNGGTNILGEKEHYWLKTLYDQHAEKDEDGIPKWYTPRSVSITQKELLEKLQVLTQHQEKTSYILERILIKLEKE